MWRVLIWAVIVALWILTPLYWLIGLGIRVPGNLVAFDPLIALIVTGLLLELTWRYGRELVQERRGRR